MSWGTPDQINRTAKILIDAGKASDPGEARRFLETLVLQVAVGRRHRARSGGAGGAGHRRERRAAGLPRRRARPSRR